MAHDHGATCLCVADHRPGVLELERHHILPRAMGGTDDPGNLVWVCPTTHTNVHELLREMLRSGPITYSAAQAMWEQPVNRYAHSLAAEGYRRFMETVGTL